MSGNEENPRLELSKIIYFDEGSASDYTQIVQGGQMSIVMEMLDENSKSASANAEGKISLKTKILKLALGIDASARVTGDAGVSFNSGIVAKSIMSNTVLTDFLEAMEEGGNIDRFEGYSISPIDNSLASYALMTPYLSMIRGGNIPAGDFNLALEKLDSTIKNAKGYFEFLAVKGRSKKVFRFNNESFKNNYKPSDLMRMNLVVYAVRVGKGSISDFDVNKEFNVIPGTAQDNPDYTPNDSKRKKPTKEGKLDVFDVMLAGVKSNG